MFNRVPVNTLQPASGAVHSAGGWLESVNWYSVKHNALLLHVVNSEPYTPDRIRPFHRKSSFVVLGTHDCYAVYGNVIAGESATISLDRRGGRVVECGGLENR